jgi:hypothetical protein
MPDNLIEEPIFPRVVTIQEISDAFVGRRPGINSPGAMYQKLPIRWEDETKAQDVHIVPSDQINNGVQLVTGVPAIVIPRQMSRRLVSIQNRGPNSVFIGDDSVNTGNGFEIASGLSRDISALSAVYGVCAAGNSADCRWFAEGD